MEGLSGEQTGDISVRSEYGERFGEKHDSVDVLFLVTRGLGLSTRDITVFLP